MAVVFKNPLYPEWSITVALFTNVQNASQLKQMAMSGEIEAALIKPAMIFDTWQILMAANQAIHLHQISAKKTRALHSEIIYSLAASRNISDSFKRFGIADDDKAVLVAAVHPCDDQIQGIIDCVKGILTDVKELCSISDLDAIKKIYKIKEEELVQGSLVDAIVNRISSKSFIAF